jgi:flavin reductase (DIM6/NTAB) family NADH-FMN oxidoreductase RutF
MKPTRPDPRAEELSSEGQSEAGRGLVAVDDLTFRSILRRFASGVAVVTTVDGGRLWGTTVNSFSSVSLRPPLVLVAFDRRRRIVAGLQKTRHYAVNILGEDQQALADCFAGGPAPAGQESFDRGSLCGAAWHAGSSGLPLLDEAIATLECTVVDIHPAGDHDLYIAHVDYALKAGGEPLPLLYYAARYLRIERASSHEPEGKPER